MKKLIREITTREAMARVLAGLPIITEEYRNEHGHAVFLYFIPEEKDNERPRSD